VTPRRRSRIRCLGAAALSHLGLDDLRRRLPCDAVVLLLRQLLLLLLQAALERRGDAGPDSGRDLLEEGSIGRGSRSGSRLLRCRLLVASVVAADVLLLLLPRLFFLFLGLRGGKRSGRGVLPPLEATTLGLLLGSRGLFEKDRASFFSRVRKKVSFPPLFFSSASKVSRLPLSRSLSLALSLSLKKHENKKNRNAPYRHRSLRCQPRRERQ